MITDEIFKVLIGKASLAPSADNMQPWEFSLKNDAIKVFCVQARTLPEDTQNMFTWISIGAAIQNIVLAATEYELLAKVHYPVADDNSQTAAIISFSEGAKNDYFAKYIDSRSTNRNPYAAISLKNDIIENLTQSIAGFDAAVHWTLSPGDFERLAYMDAHSSYIRLEHKPLHDELFKILRFTRKDFIDKKYGLNFESLGVPKFADYFTRQLQFWTINKLVSRLGIGRLVAKQLSEKLRKTGSICLITALQRNRYAYMEAGRAIEQLWLAATALGLSVQPYGVLPQYLTKIDVEPETFLPKYVAAIEKHRSPFYGIFTGALNEFPALVLRIGYARKLSARSGIRLNIEQLIHTEDSTTDGLDTLKT
jgi:nitroreductase